MLALLLAAALAPSLAACASAGGASPPAATVRVAEPRPVDRQAAYGGDRTLALDGALARAARTITAAIDAAGATRPALDPGLVDAAGELARSALPAGSSVPDPARLEEAVGPGQVRLALARAGATVLAPVVVAAAGHREEPTLDRLAHRAREAAAARVASAERPDRFGVGVARRGETVVAVLLLGRRKAAVERFPVQVRVGDAPVLAGRLLPPLEAAEVHVTPPDDAPRRLFAGGGGPGFAVPVPFDRRGRWAVEVLGHGPRGPEVALLLEVWAGEAIPPEATGDGEARAEPDDLPGKAALVHREVNALRRARGLPPLRLDTRLALAAKGYADELARTGRFAHRSEESGDPADRVRAAGYRFARIAENLAQAGSALAAHRATVESPGHLANLLDSSVTDAGYGLARARNPDGSPSLILVELFGRPAP